MSFIFGGGPKTPTYGGNLNLAGYGTSPYTSALQKSIDSGKSPLMDNVGGPYQAKDMSKTDLPQFDFQRSNANSEFAQEQAKGQDTIDRDFAAMGGGPGNGAKEKQTENLAASVAGAKAGVIGGINANEAETRTNLQNMENQKAFESGETNKQLQFGANQLPVQLAGMNQSWDEAMAQAANNKYNAELSQWQAAHSGGLFGGGGFLGLGI